MTILAFVTDRHSIGRILVHLGLRPALMDRPPPPREILRVARPETAAGWAAWARRRGVRVLRKAVEAVARREGGGHVEDDGEDFVDVRIRVQRPTKTLWEFVARELVEREEGGPAPQWLVLERLCAEYSSLYPEVAEEIVEKKEPPHLDPLREGNIVAAPTEEELLAPADALFRRSGRTWAPLVAPVGTRADREATTGIGNGRRTEVPSGLAEGDAVLLVQSAESRWNGQGQRPPSAAMPMMRR